MNWNERQLEAVEAVEGNVLVSASAGSGKTAVMVERVIRLIIGESGGRRVPLERIVCVTFTNAAAEELKGKIAAALTKALRENRGDGEYLRRQLDAIVTSNICTLHSLCGNLAREYFEEAGVDPSFSIADEADAKLYTAKALGEVMEAYDVAADATVSQLRRYFTSTTLEEEIMRLFTFSEAQTDGDKWLDETAAICYCGDVGASIYGEIFENVRARAIVLSTRAEEVGALLVSNKLDARAGHLERAKRVLDAAVEVKNFAALLEAFRLGAPEMQPLPRGGPRDDAAKAAASEHTRLNDDIKAFVAECVVPIAGMGEKGFREECAADGARIAKLVEAVHRFKERYVGLKRDENKLDFNDLEHTAVKILSDDTLAAEIAARFDYVCVDEYQDVNRVQEFILSKLSGGEKLFMVGDAKQSIYKFRLTEPAIFLDKFDEYSRRDGGRALMLNTNYRSDGRILEFVNRLFCRIMTRRSCNLDYASTSALEVGAPYERGQEERAVIVTCFDGGVDEVGFEAENGVYSVASHTVGGSGKASEEALYIASEILGIVGREKLCRIDKNNAPYFETARYGDIALLCDSRDANVADIVACIAALGIPIDASGVVRSMGDNNLAHLLDYARCIDNRHVDVSLLGAMSGALGGFGFSELAAVRRRFPACAFFYESVEAYAAECRDKLADKINGFLSGLNRYALLAGTSRSSRLLSTIVADFDYDCYILSQEGGEASYAAVEGFIENLSKKSCDASLSAFVSVCDETGTDFGTSSVAPDADCVKTSTVHKSKGLEFPIVFLINAAKEFNFGDEREKLLIDKNRGACIKRLDVQDMVYDESIIFKNISAVKKKEMLEEKMRLLYVALTRAKNRLYVTGTAGRGGFMKKVKTSATCFMDWIGDTALEDEAFARDYIVAPARREAAADTDAGTFRFRSPDASALAAFRQKFDYEYPYKSSVGLGIKYSVTAINKESAESQGVGKVMFESEGASAGTSYHRALELIDYDCADVEAVETALSDMRERGDLDASQYEAVSAEKIFAVLNSPLIRYAARCRHMRERDFMLYLPAKDVLKECEAEDKVLVQGTFDLLILGRENGGENILVDFKASRRSDDFLRAEYGEQLRLYARAAEICAGVKTDRNIIFRISDCACIEV